MTISLSFQFVIVSTIQRKLSGFRFEFQEFVSRRGAALCHTGVCDKTIIPPEHKTHWNISFQMFEEPQGPGLPGAGLSLSFSNAKEMRAKKKQIT